MTDTCLFDLVVYFYIFSKVSFIDLTEQTVMDMFFFDQVVDLVLVWILILFLRYRYWLDKYALRWSSHRFCLSLDLNICSNVSVIDSIEQTVMDTFLFDQAVDLILIWTFIFFSWYYILNWHNISWQIQTYLISCQSNFNLGHCIFLRYCILT